MFNIDDVFDEPATSIHIVDVGAASMGQGTDAYHRLTALDHVRVTGFEPNVEACAARTRDASRNQRFLPYFIGDGSERRFYQCENPLTSSLYEPNRELLSRFQRLDLPVLSSERVSTQRLDDIGEIDRCDYLKLDIQGAELDAIRGGDRVLNDALVVHTEVEFIPMYKGQALFGDIDVALRSKGFLLHKFEGMFSRQMKPIVVNNDLFSPFSQIIFAEAAVYVRDFMLFDRLSTPQLRRLATILHTVYGSFDLCAQAIDAYDQKMGTQVLTAYLDRLTGRVPLPA